MTQWVENPTGGRDRGPRAVVRAWAEVLVRPGHFFEMGVAPGDQAPGLTFAMAVVLVEELVRLSLVPNAVPSQFGGGTVGAALYLGLAVLLVTPAALHLLAAVQTVTTMLVVRDRAGISETVQILGYASAPCVFAGIPHPAVRTAAGIYATALLVVGITVVHGTTPRRAALAGAIPAALAFGYGFRAFDAIHALLRQWYVI